jgi:hypothetical protein
VSAEVTHLKSKTVLYPPYSPDLAITDFYLFDVLEQKLQGIDVSNDEELKNQILRIVQGIPSDELKKLFDRWIKKCQWVVANARTIVDYRHNTKH